MAKPLTRVTNHESNVSFTHMIKITYIVDVAEDSSSMYKLTFVIFESEHNQRNIKEVNGYLYYMTAIISLPQKLFYPVLNLG